MPLSQERSSIHKATNHQQLTAHLFMLETELLKGRAP